jgi:hypothetical protein
VHPKSPSPLAGRVGVGGTQEKKDDGGTKLTG